MVDTTKLATDLRKTIDALRRERDELDDKIAILENTLSQLGGKRGPGRPKGSKNKTSAPSRKKPNWSPAARKAAAERMRKWHAEKNKKTTKKKKTRKKATKTKA